MSRLGRWMVSGAAALAVLGCTPQTLVLQPLQMQPCYVTEQVRELSTAALLLAMEEKHWAIETASLKDGTVRAKACRRTECVVADASVAANGAIDVRPALGERLTLEEKRLMNFWLSHLARSYAKFRCYSAEYLREEMRKRVWGRELG